MLEIQPNETPRAPRGPQRKPAVKHAAKWPPDDSDMNNAPPIGGPAGAGFPDDGNFKRGRVSPISIIVGFLLLVGAVAAIVLGLQSESEKMTVQEIAKEKKNIFVLPQKDQIPEWRKWAANTDVLALQQEALMQLGYAHDEEGVPLAIKALDKNDHRLRGTAAQVLAYFGSPKADAAKPVLLKVLQEADESDRPQIVWALVTLREPGVFTAALDLYRKGHLTKVERLGGGLAFDPEKIASLVSLEELANLAGDPSPSVRQLVANILSRNADPKWTPALTKLVQDADVEVGREAASGLGKIGDEAALAPLLNALSKADKDSRQKFLEALRDGIGGAGLVLALDSIPAEPPETVWFQRKQIFEMLRELADPRAGNALVAWAEKAKPPVHWMGEIGIRLAEVGDIRAAKFLGDRMKYEPKDIYEQSRFWEADAGGHMSRTDLPRVVSARMLADLAALYPDKKAELRVAESSVLAWAQSRPQPHANALRFLANINSEEALSQMRKWAFPDDPLPKEGQQPPFPANFETAQSALRYLGRMKDEPSFKKLTDQFERKKDKKMDITQEGLMGAGLAMMGMSLRAVAYGAAQGLAEWGDSRAEKPLMDLIEDETWHEEARLAACEALAWCAEPKTMVEVAKKAKEFGSKRDKRKQLIGACYATSLSLRPVPEAADALTDLLTADLDPTLRMAFAQAIGNSGFDAAVEQKLFAKLADVEIRNAAAIALILGGTPDTAARTVAMYADFGEEALNDVKDHYFRAFGYWSDEDFKRGNLYRWVASAENIARVKVGEAPQDWARQRLQSQFDNLQYDNGPHSETRVVLRMRLYWAAKTGDTASKLGAIKTLKFMKEKGMLMALRHEQGETGELAKVAFHELMNPRLIQAENLDQLQAEQKAKQEQQK